MTRSGSRGAGRRGTVGPATCRSLAGAWTRRRPTPPGAPPSTAVPPSARRSPCGAPAAQRRPTTAGSRLAAAPRSGSGSRLGARVRLHGEQRGGLRLVEGTLAPAQPAALHVGLLAVGAHLADRDAEVDVGL